MTRWIPFEELNEFKEIGKGSSGIIYSAFLNNHGIVALKKLPKDSKKEFDIFKSLN
ncbi:4978_t:CDS:1, partial [Scutellospora calospora]